MKDYVVRMQAGKVHVLPIGSNKTVYCFEEDTNATITRDKINTRPLITRVKVMGVADEEGKQSVEAIIDGETKYGIRQRIYNRSSDDTLDAAKSAAQKIIDDEGKPEHTSTITAPDIPFMRKGDKVYLSTTAMTGFYIVRSIEHDATNRKMTINVEEYVEKPAPAQEPAPAETPTAQKTYKKGDNVWFKGGKHYVSSDATKAASTGLDAGPARIAYTNPGARHPWSLITNDWSKTHVYGWVDDGTFE